MSLMSLLLACTRQIDNPDALPTLPAPKKKKNQDYEKSGGTGGFITSFSQSFNGLWWLLELLWNTLVDVFRIFSFDNFKMVKDAMNSVRTS